MPSRDRGFDIRPHRPITAHYVNDLTYPTWSNALGCFDLEPDDNPTYAYLAGDSFAWGYVPYEATFGRRLEMSTGMPVLKCAVPHTGQRHQLAKMREIIATLPRPPAVTIVAFTPNDIANDLAHPHTVVLGGLLVDRAHLFRIDDEWVPRWTPRDRLEQDLRRREPNGGPRSTAEHVAFQISKVSLITALGYRAWAARQVHWDASYGVPIYVRDIWEHEGRLWYADNRYAKNNKLALRAFQRFCRTIGSQLILVLVPELPDARREGYFSELLGFTRASGIRTIDVGEAMRRNDVTLADFYNVGDPHLNARGHALVSSLLAREIGTRSWRDLRNGEGHTGRGIEIGGTLRW